MPSSPPPPSHKLATAAAPGGDRRLAAFPLALIVTLLLIGGYLLAGQSEAVLRLEAQTLDLRFRLRPPPTAPADVVLVLIDDDSITELGRWPWSRRRLAEVLPHLQQAGARVVAFDLLFSEPETDPASMPLLEELNRLLGLGDAAAALLRGRPELAGRLARLAAIGDPDRQLAQAMTDSRATLVPMAFSFAPHRADHQTGTLPRWLVDAAYRTVIWPGDRSQRLPATAGRLLPPVPVIGEAATAVAHVNVLLDRDGRARFDQTVVEHAGHFWPSFPIEAARLWLGLPADAVRVEFGRGIHLGEVLVPTDETMRLMVNHRRPDTIPRVSFAAVMAGIVPPETFADKVVLIGGAATGIADFFTTPFSPLAPGVERYASIVQSVIDGDFLQRRDSYGLYDLAGMLAGGALLGLAARRRNLGLLALTFVATLGALGGVAWYAFSQGIWLHVAYPAASLVVLFGTLSFNEYVFGQRQARAIRAAFSHYLHPEVVATLSRNPSLLALGGEEKELTILFADVRGFGRLADRLSPAELVALMNAFFAAMCEAILSEKGMVDKFIGDGILAVFGAPLPQPDHALRACRAALAMQRALDALAPRLAAQGLPEVRIRIGVNTGRAVLGNFGSPDRLDYTVLGDAVNLASRFEAANERFGTDILIGEVTWQAVAETLPTRPLGEVTVKGKSEPVPVFELVVSSAQAMPKQAG